MAPVTWPLFLTDNPSPGELDAAPLLQLLRSSSQWRERSSRLFRQHQTALLLEYIPPRIFPEETWRFFWKLPLQPEARSLWFRILYNKVHNNRSVSVFDPSVNSLCSLCCAGHEDAFHFFITCPYKLCIWQRALACFAPYLDFSTAVLHALVFDLQQYHLVNNTALFTLASKILRSIWRFHWLFIIENVPFQPELVLQHICE